ncbi:Ubiquinone/menaquinone biosynthesis C-methyltransferase UbiE [Symbiodinium microadriaticum]|uniref:Ubiquinone/menaquinone biosynthesis C-methyltransferase UbiE n=1 Tax=Symbiodinium microadriaticum TaxID=2951 RepID=A0A1Q9EQE6_SYMMI|nr:Ubiquinone/menaquinone biosynthesis C-methyltransferase UbiE [Symbiodinium microadriaticum]
MVSLLLWWLSLIPSGAIDANIYEKLFLVNWPMFEKITEKIVQEKAVDVLDLGTGPGQPALLIAQALPKARVHATDLQEAMISKARKRAKGVGNVDFSVASADDLSAFKPKSFDAVSMSYVLMFVQDKVKALREIGRVLRGGRHAFISVWEKMPFFTLAVDSYTALAGSEPDRLPVNPLSLAQDRAVEDLVEATNGLLEVKAVEQVSYPMLLGTADETCEAAMIIVGMLLEQLEKQGKPDPKKQFCTLYLQKLQEAGMKTVKGTYEVSGSIAKLFTLEKPEKFASEVLSLEQLTSEEEPAEADSAKDAKAARRERKKALKAERRARRAQSPEERSAAKRKPCTLCQRPVDLLVRCRIDISQKWHMLCGRCWKKASGGVPDGDASHPHYRYGGLWKNRSAKVTTPSFSGAVKAKAEEDFDSAELLLQEAYKGGSVQHLERCSGRLRFVAESEVIEPCLVTIPEIAATAGTEPPGTAHADQVPAEQAHCGKTAVTEVECRMEGSHKPKPPSL